MSGKNHEIIRKQKPRQSKHEEQRSKSGKLQSKSEGPEHPTGPNLLVLYSLAALALLAAVGLALLIVFPFYLRR
jgi:hypothetical protein